MKHSRNLKALAFIMMLGNIPSAQAQTTSQGQAPKLKTTTQTPATNEADTTAYNTYEDLDEVVVTAKRPVIQSDGAKLTYNVDEDDSSKGSTVLDMLRKVPMVSVDGEDNIRINGQSNFKIYVNGKEEPFMSANYQRILKAMPAEAVAKVEVITEPDAKYDAEGTGGILNLITERKRTDDGYSGSITASLSNRESGATLFGGMKKNRVNANLSVNYYKSLFTSQDNSANITTEYFGDNNGMRQVENFDQKINFDFLSGAGAMSWEPDDNNLFSISVNGNMVNAKDKNPLLARMDMYQPDGAKAYGYSRRIGVKMINGSVTTNASYQHTFGKQGHNLILSYLFNFGNNDMKLNYDYFDVENMNLASRLERSRNNNFTREHTVQLDYANPLAEGKHTIEAGAKTLWRHNTADGSILRGDTYDNLTVDPGSLTSMLQFQDIYAGYASYTGVFGAWSTKAGARYEHTRMGTEFRKGTMPDYTTHLNDLVPNVSLTYSFSPMQNLRLAYLMRISRPTIEQTNPFETRLEANSIRMGNPDLDSEKSHKVSLTYTHFAGAIGGNVGIEYTRINNAISSYSYMDGMTIYDTYANIGHNESAALTGFLTWSGVPNLRVNLNGRLAYVSLKSHNPDYGNHGWTLNYGVSADYKLPGNISLSAYGGQNTREYGLQSTFYGWYYYGIGLSRSFLKNDALRISLNAGDFLQSTKRFKNVVATENMKTTTRSHNKSWRIGVSLTWNFGNAKTDVKKTNTSIDNDDKADTGSSNKGSAL